MMKSPACRIVLAAVCAVVAVGIYAWLSGAVGSGPASTSLEKISLIIETRQGKTYGFSVELPRTPEQMRTGLMFRPELGANQGMLFVFPQTHIISMWMRNTRIPLDMLFIDSDGMIVDIHPDAPPFSEELINSEFPAKSVLELNGGTALKLGIAPGDSVIYKERP